MQEVVAAYKDTGDVKQVQSTGLHIAGERFIVIKADDRSIYGKKVSLFFTAGRLCFPPGAACETGWTRMGSPCA
jgi:hypothetical protein